MTKIDFHILPSADNKATFNYVCRLVQKALTRDHKVLIAADTAQQSSQISQALWSFQPQSFLAHNQIDEASHELQISSSEQCGDHHDVLINLCTQVPDYFARFERVFEVVNQQPDYLTASRERYRFYNDRGYDITRHDLRQRSTS